MRLWNQSTLLVGERRRFGNMLAVGAIALVATVLVATSAFAQQDVAGLVEQARGSFKPATEQQVAEARAKLAAQVKSFEQFVEPSTKNGKSWLKFLKLEDLKKDLANKDSKDIAALDATSAQLNRNVSGLENRHFRDLARSLQHYRDTLVLSLQPNQPEFYNKTLGALQGDLDAYHKEPSLNNEQALAERIHIIDTIGQAPNLVSAVRGELAHPNAFVNISTALIAAGAKPVDRCDPVTDCILGTNIHGDAHTTGTVGVASIPSENKAVLEFHSQGLSYSNNVGYNGPAVIRSTADTNYTAVKRVELTDKAFKGLSADVNASTDTHIHSIAKQGGGLGSGLVSRIGWKKAMQSEHQAEAIASDHAEDRIGRRFNDEVGEKLTKARKDYENQYRKPLERSGDVPEHIRFSSTKNDVAIEVTQANRTQFGAPGAPPNPAAAHDMTMRLHESAVNNYSTAMLAGATAKQTKPDEDVKFDVELPKWMDRMWKDRKTESTDNPAAKDEPFKPFTMTLQDDRPVNVKLNGDKFEVTLRIADLKSGDKSFANWDVTAVYTTELKDGVVLLHRDGKLTMLPADFSGKLDSTQTGERANLEKELEERSAQGHGFPKTIQLDPLTPEGELASAGPLDYRQFTSKDGWLVIGLDRHSKKAN